MIKIEDAYKIINFKDFGDERGKLVVVEGSQDVPFDIARVFYIYGSDDTVHRGMHANRESEFVLINVAGESKVKISNGTDEVIVSLDKPMMGLYIDRMVWKEMYEFSADSVLLVLSNKHFDEHEYIRDYESYVKEIQGIK